MTTDIKDVTPWGYCPECGEVKIHHQEGNHKQCAACYQEWFSDLDYSETVHSNLSALFLAKRSSALALEALAGEVERLTMEAKTATTLLEAEKWSRAHVRSIIVSDLEAERDRLKAALSAIAVKAGTSECGGNYVAAVSLIGDLEQMADAALRAAGDGR